MARDLTEKVRWVKWKGYEPISWRKRSRITKNRRRQCHFTAVKHFLSPSSGAKVAQRTCVMACITSGGLSFSVPRGKVTKPYCTPRKCNNLWRRPRELAECDRVSGERAAVSANGWREGSPRMKSLPLRGAWSSMVQQPRPYRLST